VHGLYFNLLIIMPALPILVNNFVTWLNLVCLVLFQVWDNMIIESALKKFYGSDLSVMIQAIQRNISVISSLYMHLFKWRGYPTYINWCSFFGHHTYFFAWTCNVYLYRRPRPTIIFSHFLQDIWLNDTSSWEHCAHNYTACPDR
jgi:hypothetical protein